MPTGYETSVAKTADYTITRDKLIELAYRTIGVLPPGETMQPEELQEGIDRLNLIVREIDESGRWRWTIESAIHLPLKAGVGVYEATTGLPINIAEILSVVYRNASGIDSQPLKILKAESYERITDKLQTGEPHAVYLTNDIALELRRLYVCPFPSTVTAQSQVTGSDGNIYKCIYPHTSSSNNAPVTGANWRMVWELSAGASSAWASGAAYTTGESIRMVIRRPIFDFDQQDNTPDFPMQFPRLLVYRLASDLADAYPATVQERDLLQAKVRGAFNDIFPSTTVKTNDIHNKVRYF